MGGFSDGDLVWSPPTTTQQGAKMWPAVIVKASDPDNPTKCFVAFIKREHENLKEILASKPFTRERNSLHLFDPWSASKFAPDPGKGKQSTSLRNHFEKVVNLTTQLFDERKRQIQEEYRQLVEKATRRSEQYDEDNANAVELAAGAHIFFWIPGMIAGRKEAEMYARVLTVHHPSRYEESQIPLELDSGHVLTFDDSVKMLQPVETKLMSLRKFKLKTSSVNGVRFADIVGQSVQGRIDKLKSQNPAFAHFFRDPFGSTRKEVAVGKQEAKDANYTPTEKKKKKKSDPLPTKPDSPKQYSVPRERTGWRPDCDNSEDEEENKLKFLPQLSIRNSQTTPNRPNEKASQTSIHSKTKPVVSNSESDGSGDNVKRNHAQSQVQKSRRLSAKSSPVRLHKEAVVADSNNYGSSCRKAASVKTIASDAAYSRSKRRKSCEIAVLAKGSGVNIITNYFKTQPKDGGFLSSPHLKRAKETTSPRLDLTQSTAEKDKINGDFKDQNWNTSELNSSKPDEANLVQNIAGSNSEKMVMPFKSKAARMISPDTRQDDGVQYEISFVMYFF